jgi:hypothetical protein
MTKHRFQAQSRSTLLSDTRGLSTVEYVIILCLIAVTCFGIWLQFGATVRDRIAEADATMGTMSGSP